MYYTNNIILRRVRVTLDTVEKKIIKYFVCVCVCVCLCLCNVSSLTPLRNEQISYCTCILASSICIYIFVLVSTTKSLCKIL